MKRATDFVLITANLAVVGVLVLVLVLAFRAVGGRGTSGVAATLQPSTLPPTGYPPPETLPPPGTPFPTPVIIELQPSQDLIVPSWTPFPTFTPQPTPTRRPGPPATPFPTHPPAPDASGTILYSLQDQPVIMALPVDGAGQPAEPAVSLPISLDASPWVVTPSPDGRYLFILASSLNEAGGTPYIFDRGSALMRPLFPSDSDVGGLGVNFLDWHPDSKQVLVYRHHDALWLVNVETGEVTVLAFISGVVRGAAISPDGQGIVYVNGRSGSAYEAVWKVSAAGSDAHPLLDLGSGEVLGWSPDGANILYVGGPGINPDGTPIGTPVPGGPFTLWLMDPAGQNLRPLASPILLLSFTPVWSPDAQWLAYTGLDEGQEYGCYKTPPPPHPCSLDGMGIYIVQVATGEARRLASGVGPVWSPDGSRLVFFSIQSGAPEIWTVGVDGTGLQQLTTDGQLKNMWAWSR